jgi:3-dehydroquinate dehydratase
MALRSNFAKLLQSSNHDICSKHRIQKSTSYAKAKISPSNAILSGNEIYIVVLHVSNVQSRFPGFRDKCGVVNNKKTKTNGLVTMATTLKFLPIIFKREIDPEIL